MWLLGHVRVAVLVALYLSLGANGATQEDTTHQKVSMRTEESMLTTPDIMPTTGSTSSARGLVIQAGDLFDQARRLFVQTDCTTQIVVAGDSCGALASRCGISGAQLSQYNPQSNLCSALTPGQRICCSPGSLPDIRPKPNPDGSCSSYIIQPQDTCSSIANTHGLTVSDLSSLNDKTTWGWFGCSDLMVGLAICLSKGTPPMPASVPVAICGPQKPGTSPPKGSVALADLNPCPLNACCNIWGQCGITPEYCVAETGPTGNPGTAPPGKNGCISNCGYDIIVRDETPPAFRTVTYYESWNWDRPCLNMRLDRIDTTIYTHIHRSFATITKDWDVSIDDQYNQFPIFAALPGVKKILSFGGWGYSTDPATYEDIRNAMSPTNAGKFIDNIVSFLTKHGLDGVDFDWEYPGAPDIPGIKPGLASDTPNYLAFLRLLREKMIKGGSISIAAPASYWYLKAFPIADMATALDYIVYMTYDLHGQWDYGNMWSQDGCPTGDCLRSHVNRTETLYALAMITKAGVPASKINVGVSSYGRSFGMSQAGCSDSICRFDGSASVSTATPGDCTAEAGYISNAEINLIIDINATGTQTWYDAESDSDILVYNGNQWVAFMNDDTKTSRINYYRNLNFGGIVDWAVDLQEFGNDSNHPDGDDDDLPPAGPLPSCDASYDTLEHLDAAANSIPFNCKAIYLVATLSNVLNAAVNSYHDMMQNGYDGKFKTYAQSVANGAAGTVRDFVNGAGNKYFSCVVGEASLCCDYCNKRNPSNSQQCLYCFSGTCYEASTQGKLEGHAISGEGALGQINEAQLFGQLAHPVERESPGHGGGQTPVVNMVKKDEPCPPDFSQRGYGPDNPYEQSVWWTLNPNNADQFWADLLTNTGIPQNKISFENYDRGNECTSNSKPDDACWGSGMDFGMPTPNGYGVNDVTNPKDMVQKALANAQGLASQLSDVRTSLELNCYEGNGFELVDSVSMPVLMIAEAVDNMATVDSVADQIDEAQRKAIILGFIGAILFFVPLAGEMLGAVTEMADVASIISILGTVGNAAMDVYTIVADPSNAPLAIFDLIMAPLALADFVQITKAANIRRGMSDDDILKLGGRMSTRMKTIRKVTGKCHEAL